MGLTRRRFIHLSGMSVLATACARSAAPRAWRAGSREEPLLAVIFLRGGADALHMVPPVGDPAYARARGRLALEQTLDFGAGFGLHPALAPLEPLARRGELAVVHACGSPHPTRSHFEAQDFMEAGAPGISDLRDGWLGRALAGESREDPFSALALAGQLPLTLRGTGAFAVADPDDFGIPGASPDARAELARLYAGADDDPVARAGRRALAALAEVERRMGRSRGRRRLRPGRGGVLLSESADHVLAMERSGLPLRAVFLESSGWDTHVSQGTGEGAMARWLGDLAGGMAKLSEGLRDQRRLTLVVMTEFGRTVRPNGSGGTDHGHGGLMWVAGPGVRGGVHGDWRGLEERELHEGRDLPVTTDWRSVLHEVLRHHRGSPPPPEVFPGFEPRSLGLFA